MMPSSPKSAGHAFGEGVSHLAEEGVPERWPAGVAGLMTSALCVALSAYALYWVLFIVQPQVYRVSFLLIALILTFLMFPARAARRTPQVSAADWLLVAATIVALGWPLFDFSRFVYRAAEPTGTDLAL